MQKSGWPELLSIPKIVYRVLYQLSFQAMLNARAKFTIVMRRPEGNQEKSLRIIISAIKTFFIVGYLENCYNLISKLTNRLLTNSYQLRSKEIMNLLFYLVMHVLICVVLKVEEIHHGSIRGIRILYHHL